MEQELIGFYDATSADNLASLLGALQRLSQRGAKLKAVFITGRAAHTNRDASIEERDDAYSARIHLLNTKRVKGFLSRAGYGDTRVFMGEAVSRTRLRTVVKHKHHADEHDYDLAKDGGNTAIDGDFSAGLAYLRELIKEMPRNKKFLVLGGGPFVELALILRHHQDIAARLGTMVIQAGDFGEGNSSNLLGGQGNSFNGACDAQSLHNLLYMHKGDIYILPSNITKQSELGFETPDEIAALGVHPELVAIYRVHYKNSAEKRGTSLFIHDLGLVMLLDQILSGNRNYPYRYTPVKVVEVPYGAPTAGEPDRRGTIIVQPARASNRYVVTAQDIKQYRSRVGEYLS